MILKMLYIGCAALGLMTLLLQLALSIFGVGDHDGADGSTDMHGEIHDGSGFSLFSVRAVAAFLAFFGLTGWWSTASGFSAVRGAGLSLLSGLVVMAAVAWLVSQQKRLNVEGNVDPRNAVGETASVYLRVPERGGGHGKIQVKVQGRTVELSAISSGEAIPTGAIVKVLRLVTPDTVEIAPIATNEGDR